MSKSELFFKKTCILQSWQDEFLVWNATKYPTVWGLTFPVEDVWTPDINIANRFVGPVIL